VPLKSPDARTETLPTYCIAADADAFVYVQILRYPKDSTTDRRQLAASVRDSVETHSKSAS
jgi:hypothetical protein